MNKNISFLFILLISGMFYSCSNTEDSTGATKHEIDIPVSKVNKITASQIFFENGQTIDIPNAENPEYSTLIIVRHAEKLSDVDNPSLNGPGIQRANNLKDILLPLNPERVYTTSFRRSVETSMPLAKAIKKPNMHYKPKKYYDLFDIVLKQHKAKRAVVIGHSNTVPEMLNLLTGEKRFQEIDERDYSNMYLVQTKGLGESEVLALKF